ETQRAVLVDDEVDRLSVVLLDQLGEALHGHRVGMAVIELRGAVERQRLGAGPADDSESAECGRRGGRGRCADEGSAVHHVSSGFGRTAAGAFGRPGNSSAASLAPEPTAAKDLANRLPAQPWRLAR